MDRIINTVTRVQNKPSVRKRIIKFTVISFVVLAVLVVGLYLLATSSFFLKMVVLPIAEDNLKMPIKAGEINVSLFSSTVEVKSLSVGKTGNQVLKCGRAFIHCDFFSLPSKIIIKKIDLEDTGINLLQTKDGKWNIPLMNKVESVKAAESKPVSVAAGDKAPSKPFELPKEIKLPVYIEVHDLKIDKLSVSVKSDIPENPYHFSVSDYSFQLKNLVPSGTPEISYSGSLMLKNKDLTVTDAKASGSGSGKLTKDLMPEKLLVKKSLKIVNGSVFGKDLSGSTLETVIDLSFDGNKFNIRQISLDDSSRGETSDKIIISAKGSIHPLQADLSINAPEIPELLLGMAGVSMGRAGTVVKATLEYRENKFHTTTDITAFHKPVGVRSGGIPGFNLKFNDELRIDLKDKSLAVGKLNASVSEELGGAVDLSLSEPFTYKWEGASSTTKSASIKLLVRNIHLKTFAPFIKSPALKLNNGSISGAANVLFDQKNKQIKVNSKFTGKEIALNISGNEVSGLSFLKTALVTIKDMKSIKVEPCKVDLFRNGRTICSVNSKVGFNLDSRKVDYQVMVSQINQDSLKVYPPLFSNTSAVGKALGRLGAFQLAAAVLGNMSLSDKKLVVNKFGAKFDRGPKGIFSPVMAKPITVNLSGTGELISQPVKAQIQSKEFDLVFAGAFMSEKQEVVSGRFSSLLNTEFNPVDKKLKVEGFADVDALRMKLGGNTTGAMSVKNKLDVKIDNFSKIDLTKLETSIYDKKSKVASVNNSGDIDIKGQTVKVNTQISGVDQGLVKIFKPGFTAEFNIHGSVNISTAGDFARPLMKAYIIADKISAPQVNEILNAHVRLDVHSGKNQIVLNAAECSLSRKKQSITNLKAKGYLAVPMSAGKSRFAINSEKLDLKLIENLLKSKQQKKLRAQAQARAQTQPQTTRRATVRTQGQTEPKAVKLDADLEVKINMKNISYGPEIICSIDNSMISVKQSKVTVDPFNMKINKTSGTLFASTDLGYSDGYPFALKSDFDSLDIAPLLRAASSKTPKKISGTVNDFNMNFTGKGFTEANLERHLKGYLRLKTADMSIPNNLDDIPIINIIMLPIESFSEIAKYVPNITTSELNKSIGAAQNICNDINNLELKSGVVDVDVRAGRANIRKLQFAGNFIKQLGFTGYIPISSNAQMKLISMLNIYSVKFPLEINGTYRDPKPNMEKMVPEFIRQNINIQKIIDNPKEGLRDIVDKAKNILDSEILKGKDAKKTDTQPKDKTTKQKDGSKNGDKLEKNVNKLINNLLEGL